jgi:hypothetical protein
MRPAPMSGESRAWRVLGARICIRAGPPRWMPRSPDAPAGTRIASCKQDCSHERERQMPIGAFVQRSYRTRRNLLLSHPVPRQPRRRLRKRVLNKTLVATLADELRIADELGVACVSAGDGGVVW